jgi:hypothetical protein
MAAKGGARPNSGRKPIHDEVKSRDLAIGAIIKKFGSIEEGLIFLLDSNEPQLQKFVFEHAIGKPKENINHSGEVSMPAIQYILPKDAETENSTG